MRERNGGVIYVGKAKSLQKRVHSYFIKHIEPKTVALMKEVSDIEYIACDSEAQAFILEAALIKEKKPKYNIELRDDKSYPYVLISAEEFPRISVGRPRDKLKGRFIGPYVNAGAVKQAIAAIRRIFGFRSCRTMPKKACLYYHLGLCPAPCQGLVNVKDYSRAVSAVEEILNGNRLSLQKALRDNMEKASGENNFELAALLRDKITGLVSLYEGRSRQHSLTSLKELLGLKTTPLVIEAIDISNISGKFACGSVVVFKSGRPEKSLYRRFRIKTVFIPDDFSMLGEVVNRRYGRIIRENLSLPDLIVVDGGLGQVNRAREILDNMGAFAVDVVGLAKENEEVWFPGASGPLVIPKDHCALHLLQSLRDEAHRFARNYHILLRSRGVKHRRMTDEARRMNKLS